MANHEIPRKARMIEEIFGVDADGNVIVCRVYQHTRQGHQHPMFYLLQYRESFRRIDRSTRWTRQFSGPHARQHMEDAGLAESRGLFAASRARAAR